MSTGNPEPDAAPQLSALEQALRPALGSVPPDQVVKCVISVLPAAVFVDESARLHGGRVRKVSVSMPEALAEAVRARTGAGGFSRYVTDAVAEQVKLDANGLVKLARGDIRARSYFEDAREARAGIVASASTLTEVLLAEEPQ